MNVISLDTQAFSAERFILFGMCSIHGGLPVLGDCAIFYRLVKDVNLRLRESPCTDFALEQQV